MSQLVSELIFWQKLCNSQEESLKQAENRLIKAKEIIYDLENKIESLLIENDKLISIIHINNKESQDNLKIYNEILEKNNNFEKEIVLKEIKINQMNNEKYDFLEKIKKIQEENDQKNYQISDLKKKIDEITIKSPKNNNFHPIITKFSKLDDEEFSNINNENKENKENIENIENLQNKVLDKFFFPQRFQIENIYKPKSKWENIGKKFAPLKFFLTKKNSLN